MGRILVCVCFDLVRGRGVGGGVVGVGECGGGILCWWLERNRFWSLVGVGCSRLIGFGGVVLYVCCCLYFRVFFLFF